MGNFTVIRTVHSIEGMYLLPFALHLCTWSNKNIAIPLQPCYGLFLNGLSKRHLKILSGQTSLELLKISWENGYSKNCRNYEKNLGVYVCKFQINFWKFLSYHIVQWPDSSSIHTYNSKTICIHSLLEWDKFTFLNGKNISDATSENKTEFFWRISSKKWKC